MNKNIHKFLGKVFLSSAAFCWMSCDNTPINLQPDTAGYNPTSSSDGIFSTHSSNGTPASSASRGTPKNSVPFIDIDECLSLFPPPDTAGLMGKCFSEQQICETIENYNGYFINRSDAETIAYEKINSILHSVKALSFSTKKRECYEDLIGFTEMPVYGVSWCSNPDREKKTDESCNPGEARIDQEYIEALLKNDSLMRNTYRERLKEINSDAIQCEGLE